MDPAEAKHSAGGTEDGVIAFRHGCRKQQQQRRDRNLLPVRKILELHGDAAGESSVKLSMMYDVAYTPDSVLH